MTTDGAIVSKNDGTEPGFYSLRSAELMLKPATTFSKKTPFTQVVCITSVRHDGCHI